MASLSQPVSKPARTWRADPISRISVFAPFVLAIYIDMTQQASFGGGMFSKPPELIGLPMGVWFQGALLAWAAIGAAIVWTTRSRLASGLGLVLFTVPAVLGLVILPAIILILQNLA